MPVVCTEVGPWNADVLGLSDKSVIEVEVKKSRSDLLREFKTKTAKHFRYANAEVSSAGPGGVPNYFYFFVPEGMEEGALKTVSELAPKAGVAVMVEDARLLAGRNVRIAKKPTRLHSHKPRPGLLATAIMRMSSELCGLQQALTTTHRAIEIHLQDIKGQALLMHARSAGTLDFEDVADVELRAAELARCVEGIEDFKGLPIEQKNRWLQASERWLEAQCVNALDWEAKAYNWSKR
jgi:hypothetical protein